LDNKQPDSVNKAHLVNQMLLVASVAQFNQQGDFLANQSQYSQPVLEEDLDRIPNRPHQMDFLEVLAVHRHLG
jgi:hypothetical protein